MAHLKPSGKGKAKAMATVKIGGEECELYNDEIFARIRADQSVTAADVDETQFAFSELAKGGGKGGSLMQFTKSCKLLVLAPSAPHLWNKTHARIPQNRVLSLSARLSRSSS